VVGGGPIERIGLCWMEAPPLTRSQVSQVFIRKYLKVSILIALVTTHALYYYEGPID
jgi:hypothetical protein